VIKFVNLLVAILFLIMGFLLIMSFTFNLSVVDELQQAANFDTWKAFILLAGIVALLASLVFAIGSWKEFQMYSGSHNSVISEMIYILGLGLELERPLCIGEDAPTEVTVSRSSSMASIFGFGYDDSFKWTFAGRKPLPREDPYVENENHPTADDIIEDDTNLLD
jgi:hypothetical protein